MTTLREKTEETLVSKGGVKSGKYQLCQQHYLPKTPLGFGMDA